MSRPELPKHANPMLQGLHKVPTVKFQILTASGKDILVGRMKIPTAPAGGHAFILRRYDTGAVSLTTMFRAAFPGAAEVDEKREASWVKENHDLTGNNGSPKDLLTIRLAGTWVDPSLALRLAEDYGIEDLIQVVANVAPEPEAEYRRSNKNKEGTTPTKSVTTKLPTPSPTASAPKRRREASPAPPPPVMEEIVPEPPRRSSRIKSPTPTATPTKSKVAKTERARTPGTSRKAVAAAPPVPTLPKAARNSEPVPEATVDDDDMHMAEIAVPNMVEDVAEQKALILGLMQTMGRSDAIMDDVMIVGEDAGAKKRAREEEDEPLLFEFKETEVTERAIATNARIPTVTERYTQLEPQTKSLAWGVLTFAFSVGLSFVPSFFT